jgi:hypothetical protein
MSAEISNSIESLRKLSPQLNKATDDANRMVQAVEAFLNDECKIGLPCFVQVWATDNGDRRGLLGYDRHNGKFRIVLKEEFNQGDEDLKDIRPWTEATRGDKLQSFTLLPRLLEAIVTEAENSIKLVAETTRTIETMKSAFAPVEVKNPAIVVRAQVMHELSDRNRAMNELNDADRAMRELRDCDREMQIHHNRALDMQGLHDRAREMQIQLEVDQQKFDAEVKRRLRAE